jgi:hypothetical protein
LAGRKLLLAHLAGASIAHAHSQPQPRSRSLRLLARLLFGDVRLDIDPSFENDSDMVSAPPSQLASADRSKVVERDEKIYRKKPEFI